MIAPWQPLFTDYEMLDFQRSFGVFVGFLIIPALVNLVVYVRGVRKLERAESPGRILGRFLAVVGGLITFVGVSLPLGSVHFLGPSLTDTSLRFPGDGGWIVLVFGSLWLAFFPVPKKVAAIWGIVWGILAVVFILVSLQGLANLVARSPGVLYIDEGRLRHHLRVHSPDDRFNARVHQSGPDLDSDRDPAGCRCAPDFIGHLGYRPRCMTLSCPPESPTERCPNRAQDAEDMNPKVWKSAP